MLSHWMANVIQVSVSLATIGVMIYSLMKWSIMMPNFAPNFFGQVQGWTFGLAVIAGAGAFLLAFINSFISRRTVNI